MRSMQEPYFFNLVTLWAFSVVLVLVYHLPGHIVFVAASGWTIGVIIAFFLLRYLDNKDFRRRHR